MEISFVIPIAPRTKKNHQDIIRTANGRRMVLPSKQYRQYERDALLFIPSVSEPIGHAVNVRAVYYTDTRRKVDITNLHQALHDLLVTSGLLADDNSRIIAATDGSRVMYDKEHPRTEVTITDFCGEEGSG